MKYITQLILGFITAATLFASGSEFKGDEEAFAGTQALVDKDLLSRVKKIAISRKTPRALNFTEFKRMQELFFSATENLEKAEANTLFKFKRELEVSLRDLFRANLSPQSRIAFIGVDGVLGLLLAGSLTLLYISDEESFKIFPASAPLMGGGITLFSRDILLRAQQNGWISQIKSFFGRCCCRGKNSENFTLPKYEAIYLEHLASLISVVTSVLLKDKIIKDENPSVEEIVLSIKKQIGSAKPQKARESLEFLLLEKEDKIEAFKKALLKG